MQVKNLEQDQGCRKFKKYIVPIIPIIFLIIAIVLNTAQRESLFIMGVNDIYDMQSHQASAWNAIENIFSLLGNPYVVVPIIALQYLFCKRKILVFVHLIYIMGGLYFMAVFKQIFQQARPFWYSTDIKALGWFCPTDFGNPSGHSFIVIALYQPLFTDFIGTKSKKITLLVWIIVTPLVMVSRMYLGDHSLDQIMFGAFLGITFLVIYRLKLQQILYSITGNLIRQHYKQFYFICNTIALIVCFLIPILTYELNLQNRLINQSYVDNLNQDCQKQATDASLKKNSLDSTIAGFLSIGIIYGFILIKNKGKKDLQYMLGLWKFNDIKSAILYIVGLIAIAIPALILIVVIPTFSKQIEVNFILKGIGVVWGGIGLSFIIPSLQNRFNWVSYGTEGQQQ